VSRAARVLFDRRGPILHPKQCLRFQVLAREDHTLVAKQLEQRVSNVLNTGTDNTLIQARAAALKQSGHAVVSVTNEIDLLDACKRTRFDVAVIGQALSAMPKQRVLSLVRTHCQKVLILELYTAREGKILRDADDWLEVPAEIVGDELVERVTALSQRHPGRRRA
jgi:DNA-binding response OmpR family regulator